MNISKIARRSALALALMLATAATARNAMADTILTFGQTGSSNTITGTASGSSTTITATNAAVSITQILGTVTAPLTGFLNLSLTSIGTAYTPVTGYVAQDFSGTFKISSLAGGNGTNYLTGVISDIAFGQGQAFTVQASTPMNTIVFTSDVITNLYPQLGAAFSFVNVAPALTIVNNTIASFAASVSGNFSGSAAPVPEPASLTLLGMGLVGLGMIRRRRTA